MTLRAFRLYWARQSYEKTAAILIYCFAKNISKKNFLSAVIFIPPALRVQLNVSSSNDSISWVTGFSLQLKKLEDFHNKAEAFLVMHVNTLSCASRSDERYEYCAKFLLTGLSYTEKEGSQKLKKQHNSNKI